jgi:hypothetical protein
MRLLYLLSMFALSLAACARPDQSACPAGDLARFAREQALRGEPGTLPGPGCELDPTQLAKVEAGRAEGIKRYCTAARGYALAIDGKKVDQSLCDEAAAKELQRGFEVGDNLRQLLSQHEFLLNQARDAERVAQTLSTGVPARVAVEKEAANLRLEARAKENDIEALRGIVAIERWR